MKRPDPHHRYRFPAEIISHAVWLYHVFSLSLRDVELILAERGVSVTHESVRRWCRKFGQSFASGLRRRRPRLGDTWHLDEVLILSANSGCWSQSGKARDARLGARPATEPLHNPRDVHRSSDANLLKSGFC